MIQPGHHTHAEILSQPEAWAAALEVLRGQADVLRALWREGQFDSVLFTGCGSTYYLSDAAATLMQEVSGIDARGLPASEIWLYPGAAYHRQRRTLLVAVSRSGETTETIRAVESFREKGTGDVLTLSCYPEAGLPKLGTLNLIFASGQEESIAQTRAFSVLYLATVALTLLWNGETLDGLEALPAVGRRLLDSYSGLAAELGRSPDFERFYFLGSGPRYGLAGELSLKMKEMSLSHSEPFRFMEFRHGPQSMVNNQTLIVGLVGEQNESYEVAVLAEMRGRGANILAMGESEIHFPADDNFTSTVSFACGAREALRGALYLPVGQMMAFEHSLARGLNPDKPHNLEAVVRL
jgi:glucosamine--fructose-6-phosphate aminotransferase (isomerizing)